MGPIFWAGRRPRRSQTASARPSSRPPKTTASSGAKVPMRIALVTGHYLPFVGGIESHVQHIARRLAATGDDVTILTQADDRSWKTEEVMEGVLVRRFSVPLPSPSFCHITVALVGASDKATTVGHSARTWLPQRCTAPGHDRWRPTPRFDPALSWDRPFASAQGVARTLPVCRQKYYRRLQVCHLCVGGRTPFAAAALPVGWREVPRDPQRGRPRNARGGRALLDGQDDHRYRGPTGELQTCRCRPSSRRPARRRLRRCDHR